MVKTVSEIAALWDRILQKIKTQIDDQMVYESFFQGTYIDSINSNVMIVVANSELATTILSTKYKSLVDGIVKEATESNFEIKFVDQASLKKNIKEEISKPSFFADSVLNPQYTFKNFVVGPSNRQAYLASVMLSKNPGQLYNPLLIYSDSGLGKTHLLHAIGNAIKETNPKAKVLYVTTQDFFEEYVKYVKGEQEGESLKNYFKTSVDVLLVDDIQFLLGKKGTEEMFFSVFQTLYQAGKQIVITSDQHPKQLQGLDERLRSRFSQGLALPITTPEKDTCEAILKMKIEANGLDVSCFDADVISYFATKFSSNVRELEGALNRLLFYVVNINPTKHITLDTAMESVQGLIDVQDDKTKLSISKIINTVADYYSLAPYQLSGRIRTSQIALARHIAMYLSRELLDAPFTKIGEAFGGKDHATVMNGVKKVENGVKTDKSLQKVISDIKERLKV
jgi:chromosomal replication initiator protein